MKFAVFPSPAIFRLSDAAIDPKAEDGRVSVRRLHEC